MFKIDLFLFNSFLRNDEQAEKINALVTAANVFVESYWPSLFAKLAEKRNIEDLILNAGSGGGGAVAVAAPAAGAAAGGDAAATPAAEEKKVTVFIFLLVFRLYHYYNSRDIFMNDIHILSAQHIILCILVSN